MHDICCSTHFLFKPGCSIQDEPTESHIHLVNNGVAVQFVNRAVTMLNMQWPLCLKSRVMTPVCSCASLPGAPPGSCSAQCAVLDTPRGDVRVHIIDETNGEILACYPADAETLAQESK
jgi:hypothetical protein